MEQILQNFLSNAQRVLALLIEYWYVTASGWIVFRLIVRIFKRNRSTPRFLGNKGEKRVIKILTQLNSNQYYVINDLVIGSKTITRQIDHLIVSDYGIFVIETKNFSGWIFGNGHDFEWTKVIYRFKKRFYNPIRQVKNQIRELRNYLPDYHQLKITPIVVFTGSATLDVKANSTAVIYLHNLKNTLLKYDQRVLTTRDKNLIFRTLISITANDKYTKKAHIQNSKRVRFEYDSKINETICPLCGSQLLNREGKYGSFIGCSAFPKCRFTTD